MKVLFPFGRMLALKNLQTLETLLVKQHGITVTFQNKKTIYPQLCCKGIQYVRDILDDHGKITNWQAARS